MPPLLDENLLHGCKQLHGGEHLTRGLIHERGSCFIECAMNSTGTLVNGVLDQPKIVQLITTRTAGVSSDLTQVMVASCVKCFLTPLVMGNHSGHPLDSKHCRPAASIFVSCVNMEMFKMCLPEFWTNSDSCNNLRLHITNCPIPA
ncbi:AAEL014593-PA [Aedes aegypti]|uniref:AAEL014593-PA n=1 Tax=Aedes aegypti TaxID=7159 RepID=Q16FY5_AEDAE|nr:AAEL014593-PA [Aedes aegypti]